MVRTVRQQILVEISGHVGRSKRVRQALRVSYNDEARKVGSEVGVINFPLTSSRLGNSGLKVSKLIIGCMHFGSTKSAAWMKEAEESLPILKAAYDAGVNTWDTADAYSDGESERIIGLTLKEYKIPRENVVIMTKAFFACNEDDIGNKEAFKQPQFANRTGLSRVHLFNAVENSLRRLQTTYIDVLQIHRLDDTPFIEVMKALHDLVQSGKVRYIGASSMWAHELAQMQAIADAHGWTRFISMQNEHNLIYREEEREMMRYCNKTGVGLVPWAPLATGALCRPASNSSKATARGKAEERRINEFTTSETDIEIINRVEELSRKKGWTMAQVAFAWSTSKVTAPIIGISSVERLNEFVTAIDYELSEEERKYLEEPYKPRPIRGFDPDRTSS